MKYLFTFRDRPAGSFKEYEAVQEYVLGLFQHWKMPDSVTIHQFVVRLGEFGGTIVLETDQASDIHLLGTVFAAFECKVEPVLDIGEAVAVELEAIRWRKEHAPG